MGVSRFVRFCFLCGVRVRFVIIVCFVMVLLIVMSMGIWLL